MATPNYWDAWEMFEKSRGRWTDALGDPWDRRFSTRHPACLAEAFERSLLNGDKAFVYQGTQFQNTMPEHCIKVIEDTRMVVPLNSLPLRADFLSSHNRIEVAHMPSAPLSFADEPADPTASLSHKTFALCPYVTVSKSVMDTKSRHFTLFLADKFIEGHAHFNSVFFESQDAQP